MTAATASISQAAGAVAPRLAELVAMPAEPSSERRRLVLRQVTDLFMATPQSLRAQSADAFDEVMQALTVDMEQAVRAELAERLAPTPHAPARLVRRLAADDIAVAEPLLRRSANLTEDDLLSLAGAQGQAHLRAISTRSGLPVSVSDVIVERGDDATLGVLLANPDAALSRRSAEAAVDRALVNPDLHAAVVNRQGLPPDLLNEMYFVVESRLRRTIAARNAALDPAALDAALAAGRKRLAARDGALPPDYADAEIYVRGLKASGGALANALPNLLRARQQTRFLVAFADLTDVEFAAVARIVERRDLDALAILCKAADFERALFVTLAVMIGDDGEGLAKAAEYGALYGKLPRETAQRTLRFWRMRRESDLVAA